MATTIHPRFTMTPHALVAPILFFAASLPSADTIVRTDGRKIENVQIVSETMTEVVYKKGRNAQTLPAERILQIHFEKKPRLLDEAEAFVGEDDLGAALDAVDEYVEGQIERPNERLKWAPAYAAWRAIELRQSLADLAGARQAALRLIDNFADSRYIPGAYLAKASAEIDSGQASEALKTLEKFAALVEKNQLSKRYDLECRMVRIRAEERRSGKARRTDLGIIAREAGSEFPTVKSRAELLEGEVFLSEASRTVNPGKAAELRGKAQLVFERIVKTENATETTLAGAYTGLGECLYYAGAEQEDEELLKRASMYFLRVVTLFKGESRYVSKSLYFAMRCFHLTQDKKRKADMLRELKSLFPNSGWIGEAEKIR